MAESSESGGFDWGALIGAATNLATPFYEKFAYGDQTASELALARERARINALNGSGANNSRAAILNAGGIRDFLFGSPDTRDMGTGGLAASSGFLIPALVILAVGGLIFFFLRR